MEESKKAESSKDEKVSTEKNNNPESNTKKTSSEENVKKAETKKEVSKKEENSEKKPKKKMGTFKKSIIIILVVVILCAIGSLIYFLGFAPRTIDLSKYISLDYEGFDGRATVTATANEEALNDYLKDDDLARRFASRIEENMTLSETEDLSNGDEIEIKVKISSSWLKENRLKLENDTIKIKVSGIEEAGTLDIADYIDVEYTGFNGYATAEVSIDKVKLEKAVDDENLASQIANKIDLSVSNNGKLSNGDKIEVTVKIDEDWLEENGYKIKSEKFTTDEVKDLDEATVLDAFKDITVTVSGMSPNLKASVTNNTSNEFLKTVKYTLSKSTGISNGETITITANYDKDEAAKQGFVLEKETYEYKVTAEISYPMSVSELSTGTIETMKSKYLEQARSKANESKNLVYDNFTDYRAAGVNAGFDDWGYSWDDKWELDITVGEPVLSSMYLLSAKDTSDGFNYVYAIYRVPFTSAVTGTSYDWYITVEAENVSVKSDGTLTENASYTVYTEDGTSQESAYSKYINSKKSDYNVETIA